MLEKQKQKSQTTFSKVAGHGLGTLVGVRTGQTKINPTEVTTKKTKNVIERYDYEAIRTDLINISRSCLNRFQEKTNHFLFNHHIYYYYNYFQSFLRASKDH